MHEWFLRHPTDLSADKVRLLLPESYRDAIDVAGLSNGWQREGDNQVYRATGDCELHLLSLVVRAKELDVTLVAGGAEPEVVIQALGHATLAQSVKGVGSWYDDVRLIQIRNERMRIAD